MAYDNVAKKYFINTQFKPANNISDGFDAIGDTSFPIESPNPLNVYNIVNYLKR